MILTGLQRRQLLKTAVALPLILLRQFPLQRLWAAPEHDVSGSRSKRERLLVLVELQGGNDGLNTLVPFEERSYYEPGRSWRFRGIRFASLHLSWAFIRPSRP